MYKVINTITNETMMTGTKWECVDYLAWVRENAPRLIDNFSIITINH